MSAGAGARAADPALDWARIALVVFDLDGTLYDARRLRWRMAAWLLADALRHRSLRVPRALAAFRRMREALADAGLRKEVDFLRLQYRLPAERVGCRPGELQAWVEDWMGARPLRHLAACRRPGVGALFDALHAQGKRVAVLSDYPAQDKLEALGLEADLVVWAGDAGVGRLKPHPRGLRQILARTGISAERTLVVGDRADRDGAVAAQVGAQAVLVGRPARRAQHGRAATHSDAAIWIRGFDDPLFAPLFSPDLSRATAATAL
jgi:FMN phosphatase YigB (HAD superfamily)